MKEQIESTIEELKKEYEKLKLSKFNDKHRDNISELMILEQDIYRSIFHLERVLKNITYNS